MKKLISAMALTLSLGISPFAAVAKPAAPDTAKVITKEMIEDIHKWIDTDVVRQSIVAQNVRYGELAQEKIDALDKQWREEREADDKPLIAATLSNPLSVYLSRMQGKSVGLFVEIFVMDNKGLNVGQSSITSDYWQGDEAKYQKTFPADGMDMFIDEAEWDEDFKIWRAQVNMPVYDAGGSTKIGAVTVEVNLTEAQRRLMPEASEAF
ncbi:MAG: hypothetical protein R3D43_12415 [Tepidamorphaceae bacterium]